MENILKKLVAFPTVSGDAQAMHELLQYVADFVMQRGMHVAWYESNGYESIVATVKPGDMTPKVMLGAHADVVPANAELFDLRKSKGKYYGRGVLDMKFALAAYLQIIDNLKDNLQAYDFGLMVTSDEEVGGHNGVAKLIDEGYLPQVCILPDGGDNWQIQTSSKGLWLFEIHAEGRTAHGSRPWLGDNAIHKLLIALDDIMALFPKHLHPDTNTISLSQLNGGEAMNQVPHHASMRVDVRTINSKEHARIYDNIVRICRKHGLRQQFIGDAAPTKFDLTDPLIAPFAQLVTSVTGVTQYGYHALGASDVRYYVPFGIPCISVYPIGGQLHAADEWVDVNACHQFMDITQQYLQLIAPVDSSDRIQ
jgi:acetylornithine deacetylase/succinyl-diaminopimelate desuccinylase-like protein